MRGEKPSWSAADIAVAILLFSIVGLIAFGILMVWTHTSNFETIAGFTFIGVAISYFILHEFFVERRFKLENSRQFVMKADTASYHKLSDKADKDGYVTMEYYGRKYYYRVIRIALKTFTWSENYHTVHDTRMYFIFEKKTDDQPPNYPHMARMREKEKVKAKKA